MRSASNLPLGIGAAILGAVISVGVLGAQQGADKPARIDYLTLANGAVPVALGGDAEALGVGFDRALRVVDGRGGVFGLTARPAAPEGAVEIVFALPAPTTFDRFAVPDVLETPSPGQTFFKLVEVHGSATAADAGYTLLASATLAAHRTAGEVTELAIRAKSPVRWVKLRLAGGLDTPRATTFLEFSEIIGNGRQDAPPLSDRFTGSWSARGVALDLRQDGAVVTGCYDAGGELRGTVTGNILRATGVVPQTTVPSHFIVSVLDDGSLRGVRSTNGAPFTLYGGPGAKGPAGKCPAPPPPPTLGCGAVIHGISFDFDSAAIRQDSEPVLAALFAGLRDDSSATVTIEGHTSSEGSDAYNLGLSERRAAAVVADLTKRGIAAGRLRAVGRGESQPIATNDDESGRALNRRVEVRCQ